jgi:GPH family glycoside/pentoside/hexuronide:cation symporter
MTTDSARLSVKEKLGYGLGDTASHFVWDMVGFWILIFYTDTFGISAAAAGTIMFIARFWDMASDPLMGVISDRTRTRWGKFRPYILWMALPYSFLAVLAFSTPDLGQTGKVVYAAVTYLLLMTAYTAINLPYSSLGAVMTSDSYERTSLNTYRFVCAFAGQLIVSGLALTLAGYFGQGDSARGYRLTVTLFAVIAFVLFIVAFLSTRERIQPPPTQQDSVKQDFRILLANRPWVILAAVGIVSFVMFALQNLSLAYYFKYYIGREESVQLFNVVGSVALIVALPLSKPLAQRFGKRNVFIGSSLLSGSFFILLYLPGAQSLGWIYVLNILGKMAYAPAVPLLWTMIADAADYAEWTTGRRASPEGRLGHRRGTGGLAARRLRLRAAGHRANRSRADRDQAPDLGVPGSALYVLRVRPDLLFPRRAHLRNDEARTGRTARRGDARRAGMRMAGTLSGTL